MKTENCLIKHLLKHCGFKVTVEQCIARDLLKQRLWQTVPGSCCSAVFRVEVSGLK